MFKLSNLIKKHSYKLLTFVGLFLLVPKQAFAEWSLVSLALDSVWDIVLGMVSLVIDLFGTLIITAAGSIVNYVFSFQSFATVPVVQIGWTISRDLANMFFILIMLFIAFVTVLKMDTYNYKKLIPKLVIAALTINFSLIICASVIDFGNTISRFFISGGNTSEELDVSASILSSLRAGTIAQLRNNVSGESPVTSLIMASIGQLIMYVVIAFLLLAFAGVMISRLIKLWILIIVSPLAWVSSALPGIKGVSGLSNHFSEWWKKFFDLAVFFPISISFFLMLGLIAGSTFNSLKQESIRDISGSNFESIQAAGGFWETLFPSTGFSVIMQFIIVIGILWYGLGQAQKSGTMGGKLVVGWAESTKKWAENKAKTSAKLAGSSLTRGLLFKKGEGGERKEMRTPVSSTFKSLSKIPGVRIGTGMAAAGIQALSEQKKKIVEGHEGNLKKMSSDVLRSMFPALSADEQAAAIRILADKGQLEMMNKNDVIAQRLKKSPKDLTDDEKKLELDADEKKKIGTLHPDKNGLITQSAFENSLKYAGTVGLDKEILTAAPQFADIVGKKISDIINKTPPGKASKIQRGSLELDVVKVAIKDAVISKNWDAGQLSAIARENPKAATDLIDYLNSSLTKAQIDALPKKMKSFLKGAPGAEAMEDEEENKQQEQQNTQPAPEFPVIDAGGL